MKCPHCFLELRLMLQYNKEVDQCPKCEGIWLDKDNSENMFDFTEGDKKIQQLPDFQDTIDENHDNKLQNEYYYYKKPFKENGNLDDMFDFE
jgi:Zn-finger nucleic acid-binding protein